MYEISFSTKLCRPSETLKSSQKLQTRRELVYSRTLLYEDSGKSRNFPFQVLNARSQLNVKRVRGKWSPSIPWKSCRSKRTRTEWQATFPTTRRRGVGSKVHHLRATFTYEASRTRGNDRAVQLPDVTCILHPPRHDDPFSLCPPTRRYDDGPPTSMNFHSRPATPISSLSIDRHILFSIDGQICIARVIHLLCYSHDFIVNSSRMKGSWCLVNDYAIDDLCIILFYYALFLSFTTDVSMQIAMEKCRRFTL